MAASASSRCRRRPRIGFHPPRHSNATDVEIGYRPRRTACHWLLSLVKTPILTCHRFGGGPVCWTAKAMDGIILWSGGRWIFTGSNWRSPPGRGGKARCVRFTPNLAARTEPSAEMISGPRDSWNGGTGKARRFYRAGRTLTSVMCPAAETAECHPRSALLRLRLMSSWYM